MIELVYKLNLPFDISSTFTSSFIERTNKDISKINYKYIENIRNVFTDEILKLKNIEWDHALYFKKYNATGYIHNDVQDIYPNAYPWGINFVWGGECILYYWEQNAVVKNGKTNIENRTGKGVANLYSANSKPYKQYYMLPGVYLVNGYEPHLAVGLNDRKVISLRSSKDQVHITWDDIVSKFKDLILWNTYTN